MGQAFQGQEGTCPKYRYANRKGFTLLLLLSLLHDLIGIYSFWYFEVDGHLEEFLESQSIVPLFRWILLKRTDGLNWFQAYFPVEDSCVYVPIWVA